MTGVPIRYQPKSPFHRELGARVDEYFGKAGLARRGLSRMYLKTGTILLWLATSYVLLVFYAAAWWQAIPLALSLAMAMAATGFNIPHDAGHGGYSDSKRLNRLALFAFDIIGGSSYLWYWRHNVLHHNYTNLAGVDDDISVGPLGRLSPEQPRYRPHRFQHIYMWFLYGFVTLKWEIVDDFVELIRGKIGSVSIPRPGLRDATVFAIGKTAFFLLALVIPALVHPIGVVILAYVGTAFTAGVIIGVTFQLAHCMEEAEFPAIPDSNKISTGWAEHQVQTTVDFARSNRLLTWYLGGLNFQVVHHLFPTVCHLHYPTLARIVEDTCGEFGVRYVAHPTLGSALGSHFRWLRQLGRPELEAASRAAATR